MQTMLTGRLVGYTEAGSGRPLVLIHAFPLNRMMWEPQLNRLSEDAHVITLDLWGFGESAPVSNTDMGTYAQEVHELLARRGVTEPAILCGLSIGGYIAFEYFRRYRSQVAGMILANTKAGPDSAEGKAGRDKNVALAQDKGAGGIATGILPKLLSPKTYQTRPQLVEQVAQLMTTATVQGIIAAQLAMRDRPDSTPTLADITMPSLVIGSADDQFFSPSEFEELAHGLPQRRLEILPDAGHLSNLEQPILFNRAVKEYLQALP